MTSISRLAMAAVFAAGFGSIAQAQSHPRQVKPAQDRFSALYLDSGDVVDSTARRSGAVPPSESHTVMGLRVPR